MPTTNQAIAPSTAAAISTPPIQYPVFDALGVPNAARASSPLTTAHTRNSLHPRVRELFDKDLVVVTGKGGVGKTTVAAALGLAAAAAGKRTIVAEVARRDDISRILSGSGAQPFDERSVADGLSHVSIDPQHAMEEYLVNQLPSKALAEALGRSRTFGYLAAATPGMRELLTVGKVWELAQDKRRAIGGGAIYDLVILDAPATGHGVAVLSAPRTFADAARVGPVARQGRIIHDMLTDPRRTAVIAVASPEEMPVNETLALRTSLREQLGIGLSAVVANGLLPDRLSAADARALAAVAHPAAAIALSHHARARAQRAQVTRLKRGLHGEVDVTTLPLVVAERLSPTDLQALGRRLAK
jgi:anion-transporting  ArsA/GET3 family ATPase